jgi:hypothetical protein
VLHPNPIINALLILLGIGILLVAICIGGVLLFHFFRDFPTVGAVLVSSIKLISITVVIGFILLCILFALAS